MAMLNNQMVIVYTYIYIYEGFGCSDPTLRSAITSAATRHCRGRSCYCGVPSHWLVLCESCAGSYHRCFSCLPCSTVNILDLGYFDIKLLVAALSSPSSLTPGSVAAVKLAHCLVVDLFGFWSLTCSSLLISTPCTPT